MGTIIKNKVVYGGGGSSEDFSKLIPDDASETNKLATESEIQRIIFEPTKPSSGSKAYYIRIPREKVSGILTYYSEYSTSATGAIIMQRYNGFISLETNVPYVVGSTQLSAYYDSDYIYIYHSVMATRYNQKIYLFADNIQNSGAELVETKPTTTTIKNYNLSQFVSNGALGKLASITVPAETTTIFCNIGYDNYSTTVDDYRVKSPYTHITTENRRLDLMFSQSKVYILSDEDNLMSKMTFKNNSSDSNSYEFVITCNFDEEIVLYANSPYDAGEFYSGYEPEGFTNVMQVIDLTDINSIAAVIPNNASASNQLVAHQIPYESFTLNNDSNLRKWYKLGTYMSGNNTARLDFVSARVDGQMFESSVRISGNGIDANYVSWIGEKGCEVSIFSVKVDTNRNIYIEINSYSAVEIRVYGAFTLDISEQSSQPSGAGIALQELVTKSDLIVTANGNDSTAEGLNVSSTWEITSNGSLCICYGTNTEAFNPTEANMTSMQLPSGYVFDNVISANIFMDGRTSWVTGTSHKSGNGAGTYVTASGLVNAGSFRQIVLAHKA